MPDYRYFCSKCKEPFTVHKSMKDYSPIEEHECGEKCNRLIEDLVSNYTDVPGFYGKTSK